MKILRILLSFALLISFASPLLAEQVEIVAGAGPSTEIVKLFFKQLPKYEDVGNYRFIVPEMSAKHRGGIINADNFLFGRTGRPLDKFDSALGKKEIILAEIPAAIVAGNGVPRILFSMDDIRKIFLGETSNWKAFGGSDVPIERVGRERLEAVFRSLKEKYPFFKQVTFDRVFHLDNEVVDFLNSPAGKYSISFGAAPNFDKSAQVNVTNFSCGIKVGLVYDVVNEEHPIVLAAKTFKTSQYWKRLVLEAGMLTVD